MLRTNPPLFLQASSIYEVLQGLGDDDQVFIVEEMDGLALTVRTVPQRWQPPTQAARGHV